MSAGKKMMLRVQSPEGTSRVEVLDSDVTSHLFEKIYETLHLSSFGFALHKDRQRKEEITSSKSRQLKEYGLQHGDMLYLSAVNGTVLYDQPSTSSEINKPFGETAKAGPSTQKMDSQPSSKAPKEDEVDLVLHRLSGKIQRQRDEKLCRHNSKGCCVHCSPLEPWDENYLKEHNIKHMSFHAYLRKITSGKFISLDEISLKIKPGCKEHPPWPRGICSKCQPGPLTLNRQPYRHVDNVLIEHPDVVDRFLAYWRSTGHQRIGFLYGRYEPHPDVPLGIRARVAAVYEPAQNSWRDGVTLLTDDKQPVLQRIAEALQLECVGWIFTDLLPDDVTAGTVKHTRGVDTHFLSAQECIMAAHFQNEHPNACRYASSGYFGSKFVTVCVTGDEQHQVHLEGYQVSGQCQALVRDGLLLPTKDAPELAYIRDCTDQLYVPDVYYKERDAYGNEVGVSAKRMPVAYVLVDVPCGVSASSPSLCVPPAHALPPAHRPLQPQGLPALHRHVQACDNLLQAMSDLHVLLYVATNEAMPLDVDTLRPLLEAVRLKDRPAAEEFRENPQWKQLEALAQAAHRAHSDDHWESSGQGEWTCQLCTFHNAPHHDSCDMCAMPRQNAM